MIGHISSILSKEEVSSKRRTKVQTFGNSRNVSTGPVLNVKCQMSNLRDWCRCGMSWNEKPKDLYWNWPVLYKQQIIVALISKQPTIPMFSFFLLIVFDQSQMFAIQKAKSIGNLEETCSLEIPCWQSSAVAKPTEHNDEDQSWDKILQFSKAWLSVALVFSCTNSSSI